MTTIIVVHIAVDPAGHFGFTMIGPGGGNYYIQGSTNLIDWSYLLITNSASGWIQFTDTMTSGRRFYRGGVHGLVELDGIRTARRTGERGT